MDEYIHQLLQNTCCSTSERSLPAVDHIQKFMKTLPAAANKDFSPHTAASAEGLKVAANVEEATLNEWTQSEECWVWFSSYSTKKLRCKCQDFTEPWESYKYRGSLNRHQRGFHSAYSDNATQKCFWKGFIKQNVEEDEPDCCRFSHVIYARIIDWVKEFHFSWNCRTFYWQPSVMTLTAQPWDK